MAFEFKQGQIISGDYMIRRPDYPYEDDWSLGGENWVGQWYDRPTRRERLDDDPNLGAESRFGSSVVVGHGLIVVGSPGIEADEPRATWDGYRGVITAYSATDIDTVNPLWSYSGGNFYRWVGTALALGNGYIYAYAKYVDGDVILVFSLQGDLINIIHAPSLLPIRDTNNIITTNPLPSSPSRAGWKDDRANNFAGQDYPNQGSSAWTGNYSNNGSISNPYTAQSLYPFPPGIVNGATLWTTQYAEWDIQADGYIAFEIELENGGYEDRLYLFRNNGIEASAYTYGITHDEVKDITSKVINVYAGDVIRIQYSRRDKYNQFGIYSDVAKLNYMYGVSKALADTSVEAPFHIYDEEMTSEDILPISYSRLPQGTVRPKVGLNLDTEVSQPWGNKEQTFFGSFVYDENFGASSRSIAAGCGRLVIGSPYADPGLMYQHSGSVIIYNKTGGKRNDEQTSYASTHNNKGYGYTHLISPGNTFNRLGIRNELFGYSVDIGQGRIIVGAPGNNRAYLFDLNGKHIKTMAKPSGFTAFGFGSAVAVGGGVIAVSDPYGKVGTYYTSDQQSVGYVALYDINGDYIGYTHQTGDQDVWWDSANNTYKQYRHYYFGDSLKIRDGLLLIGNRNERGLRQEKITQYFSDINTGEITKIFTDGYIGEDNPCGIHALPLKNIHNVRDGIGLFGDEELLFYTDFIDMKESSWYDALIDEDVSRFGWNGAFDMAHGQLVVGDAGQSGGGAIYTFSEDNSPQVTDIFQIFDR